jgi:hypothetical protein
MFYMAASNCPQNHNVSEKYKTVQSFKINLLQNNFLAELYASARNCKSVGNIPGCHSVKVFSALPSHS